MYHRLVYPVPYKNSHMLMLDITKRQILLYIGRNVNTRVKFTGWLLKVYFRFFAARSIRYVTPQ